MAETGSTQPTQEEQARSFQQVLMEMNRGELNARLSEELKHIGETLSEHAASVGRAKGELAIKLKFVLEAGGQVAILPEITVKLPKAIHATSFMWLSPGNNFVGEDPRQLTIGDVRRLDDQRQAKRL